MVVLALETVTPLGSLAVWNDGACLSRVGDDLTPHATRLPGSWMAALADAHVRIDEVDRLVVVTGPGSFTGLRIGIASAQGLALTRGWSVQGVPTLDAIAECWRGSHEGTSPRTVIACLDGLRGEVFSREFQFDGQRMIPQGDPMVGIPAALTWTACAGGVSIVGSGALSHAGVFGSRADDITDVAEPIAAGAARLAVGGSVAHVPPHALRPVYVRRPDVELARERGRPSVR